MSLAWMLTVLFAAALHASWNAIIKAGSDKFNDTVLVAIGAALFPGFLLPWLPLPAAASLPYLIASVAVHFVYFSLVALAYRAGDLSYAYPLMRGVAPMSTALAGSVIIGEPLTPGGKIGVLLLSCGILALAADSRRAGKFAGLQTAVALANAAVISIYTLVDGIGLRLADGPMSYICWLLFLTAPPLVLFSLVTQRGAFLAQLKSRWRAGLVGGLCTSVSYGLALYAMAYIPIALVAALRETSVVFGTAIAALFLGERFGPVRYVAAGLVTAGAVAMKAL
ncbi:MAG TPA: DMT family transporter [Candidatus Binatia bacterium]